MSSLHGDDQLLLTTLQGVVNRRRPRLYFNYDAGGVDLRWLAGTGADVTRHDNALDLIGRYRGEVRGAVLHDPEVPDSVNVATTLAGLENAVAATAEQASRYGLKVVADLRGRFADDPQAVYRWQLDNLFPRCAHTLLAGLPPTRTGLIRCDSSGPGAVRMSAPSPPCPISLSGAVQVQRVAATAGPVEDESAAPAPCR
ncbi:GxGYxYP domain-containing protein [Streptomyces sp. NPDC002206]